MYKSLGIVLSLSLLSACTDPVDKEFNREGEQLSITTTFSENMKRDVWKYEEGIMGQALYSPNDNVCNIIISDKLSTSEQQRTLGHEVMHCLYGDYHK